MACVGAMFAIDITKFEYPNASTVADLIKPSMPVSMTHGEGNKTLRVFQAPYWKAIFDEKHMSRVVDNEKVYLLLSKLRTTDITSADLSLKGSCVDPQTTEARVVWLKKYGSISPAHIVTRV